MRAVRATVEGAVRLDAVADDLAAAVRADGGELVDRALEAVERVSDAGRHDLERHLVVVPADLALGHRSSGAFDARLQVVGHQSSDRCGSACPIPASGVQIPRLAALA